MLFRERGRAREKYQWEREISISYLPYTPRPGIIHSWIGIRAYILCMCPDQESNPQPFSYRTTLQTTEPHQAALRVITIFYFSQSDGYIVISHCGFNLHFFNGCQCWISFHALNCHLYILFSVTPVHVFCPFPNWVVWVLILFSCIEL